MTTPTTAELLKYADLQMAAEAFLVNTQSEPLTGDLYLQALIDGNKHSSKFTEPQAIEFEKNWRVLDQRANTPTGFSGTLFQNRVTGELVMSFRSTEFADDSARDNQATNAMEIKETGFAWGQLRDMEEWYAELKNDSDKLGSKTFSVTGYSLGGHLATAFNVMHGVQGDNDPIDKVVTFNGAGIGAIDISTYLKTLVSDFTSLAANTDGQAFTFEDSNDVLKGGYGDDWVNSPAVDAIYLVAACAHAPCARGGFDAKERVCRASKSSWRDRTLRQAGAPAQRAA